MAYTVVLLQLRFSGSLQGHFLHLCRHFWWPVPSSNSKKQLPQGCAVMPQKLLPMGDQKAGMLVGLAADGQNPRETGWFLKIHEDPIIMKIIQDMIAAFSCPFSPGPTDGGVCPSILGNLSRRGHDDKCRKMHWKYQCLSFCFPSSWSDTNPNTQKPLTPWRLQRAHMDPRQRDPLTDCCCTNRSDRIKLVHVSVLHRWNPSTAYQESGV